jgi:hypothetical protein
MLSNPQRFVAGQKEFLFAGTWNSNKKKFAIFLLILFVTGIVFWVKYLELSSIFYSNHDWPNIYSYLTTLQQALREGQIPFHTSIFIQGTNRFLANPEIPLSPQILLLLFQDPKLFVLTNSLILYTVGFIGIYLIQRKFSLSPFSLTILFLLFNFNGHIVAHLSVGHYMWMGYFFLPYFVLFLSEIYLGKPTKSVPFNLAFVLFAIILQGSVHIFVFCLMFLILSLAFVRSNKRVVWSSVVYSVLLASFKLWPATLIYFFRAWASGYPTIADSVKSLMVIAPDNNFVIRDTGFWEYNLYIGILGFVFLIVFAITPYLMNRKRQYYKQLDALFLPVSIMSFLSVGYIYQSIVEFIQIPFLKIERVPSRFLIIPFEFLLLIAVLQFDKIFRSKRITVGKSIIAFIVLGIESNSLLFNARVWRLHAIESRFLQTYSSIDVNNAISIISIADPGYLLVLIASWAISLLTLIYLIIIVIKADYLTSLNAKANRSVQ